MWLSHTGTFLGYLLEYPKSLGLDVKNVLAHLLANCKTFRQMALCVYRRHQS